MKVPWGRRAPVTADELARLRALEAAVHQTLDLASGPPGAVLSPSQAALVYKIALDHLRAAAQAPSAAEGEK